MALVPLEKQTSQNKLHFWFNRNHEMYIYGETCYLCLKEIDWTLPSVNTYVRDCKCPCPKWDDCYCKCTVSCVCDGVNENDHYGICEMTKRKVSFHPHCRNRRNVFRYVIRGNPTNFMYQQLQGRYNTYSDKCL